MVFVIFYYLEETRKHGNDMDCEIHHRIYRNGFLIILGNGAVANVDLKGTKGHNSGWLVIAFGYGLGVMMPALMFGNVSGNHINPAFTVGLAVSGLFPWAHVLQYVVAQLLGAIFGQLVVVMVYKPYFMKTENPNHVLGSFSTISSLDNGQKTAIKPLISMVS